MEAELPGQPAEPDDGKFLGQGSLEGADAGSEGTHKAITSFNCLLDGVLGVAECNGVFEVLDILFEFLGLADPDGERHGTAGGLGQRRGGRHDRQDGLVAVGEVGIFNSPDICGHFRTF